MTTRQTIVMLQGLPGSGKTTLADELARQGGDKVWRISMEKLHDAVGVDPLIPEQRRLVYILRNQAIASALQHGAEQVILDGVHLNPKYERDLRRRFGAVADVRVSFVDTPLEECIRRDLTRVRSVGEAVIREYHNQWLTDHEQATQDYLPWNPALRDAVICDLDGTLASRTGRRWSEYHRVGEDSLNQPVLAALRRLSNSCRILIVSGRPLSCWAETERWLVRNLVPWDEMYLVGDADRPDVETKRQCFEEHIRGRYNVRCVLEDRNRVVAMWRRLGLLCLQVAGGDF